MVSYTKTLKMLTICIASSTLNDVFTKNCCCAQKEIQTQTEYITSKEIVNVPVQVPVFNEEYAIKIDNNSGTLQIVNLITKIYKLIEYVTGSNITKAVKDQSFTKLYRDRIKSINGCLTYSVLRDIINEIEIEENELLGKIDNDITNDNNVSNLQEITSKLTEINKNIIAILVSTLEKFTAQVFTSYFPISNFENKENNNAACGESICSKAPKSILDINYNREHFKNVYNLISSIGTRKDIGVEKQLVEMKLLSDLIGTMASFNRLDVRPIMVKKINVEVDADKKDMNIELLENIRFHSLDNLSKTIESIRKNFIDKNTDLSVGSTCYKIINDIMNEFIFITQFKLTSIFYNLSNSVEDKLNIASDSFGRDAMNLSKKIMLSQSKMGKGVKVSLILAIIDDNFEIVKGINNVIYGNGISNNSNTPVFYSTSKDEAGICDRADLNMLRSLKDIIDFARSNGVKSNLVDILGKKIFDLKVKINKKVDNTCKTVSKLLEKRTIVENATITIAYLNNTKFNNIVDES